MKTAVSLPDKLFAEAEKVAKRLSLSRSQLYARAIGDFVSKWSADEVRESYDRAYAEAETDEEAAFRKEAARRRLAETKW